MFNSLNIFGLKMFSQQNTKDMVVDGQLCCDFLQNFINLLIFAK